MLTGDGAGVVSVGGATECLVALVLSAEWPLTALGDWSVSGD